ncbi:hypothetical protein NUACC21_50170 [Scytonema sp. NUACC21]
MQVQGNREPGLHLVANFCQSVMEPGGNVYVLSGKGVQIPYNWDGSIGSQFLHSSTGVGAKQS